MTSSYRRVCGVPGLVVEVAGIAWGAVVPRAQPHLFPAANTGICMVNQASQEAMVCYLLHVPQRT